VVAGIETRALLAAATRDDLIVQVMPAVGDGIEEGAELLRIWGPGGEERSALRNAVVVGDERVFDQDPMFALRVLVDIAIRALSSAVNDPTTSTQCLHRIESLLVVLGSRRLETSAVHDHEGALRLIVPAPTWDDFVDLALVEIRSAGADQPQVTRRQRALLDRLTTLCPRDASRRSRDTGSSSTKSSRPYSRCHTNAPSPTAPTPRASAAHSPTATNDCAPAKPSEPRRSDKACRRRRARQGGRCRVRRRRWIVRRLVGGAEGLLSDYWIRGEHPFFFEATVEAFDP
jgi:hypothetical protein